MTGRSWLDQRLDLSRWTGLLVVGDLIALTGFVVVAGQTRHSMGNPRANPAVLFGALTPFLVGWLIVALIGGLYTHDALVSPRRMLSWTVPAWILGSLIALVLRATSLFSGDVSGLFPVVAIVFGGVVLIGWRVVAAVVLSRPS